MKCYLISYGLLEGAKHGYLPYGLQMAMFGEGEVPAEMVQEISASSRAFYSI